MKSGFTIELDSHVKGRKKREKLSIPALKRKKFGEDISVNENLEWNNGEVCDTLFSIIYRANIP